MYAESTSKYVQSGSMLCGTNTHGILRLEIRGLSTEGQLRLSLQSLLVVLVEPRSLQAAGIETYGVGTGKVSL